MHNLPLMDGTGGFRRDVLGRGYNLRSCNVLAVGERACSFKAISAGMLSSLGIIFGLFVVFTAAQVWQDNERANRNVRAPQCAALAT
jgi:hypothetical protein